MQDKYVKLHRGRILDKPVNVYIQANTDCAHELVEELATIT